MPAVVVGRMSKVPAQVDVVGKAAGNAVKRRPTGFVAWRVSTVVVGRVSAVVAGRVSAVVVGRASEVEA